ncbi:MAG: hypothetical protein KAI47_13675, partial [Deltaproteobacteria bacterium]|nr:hypothetical protein [Deltaproteobacteria bacterium]
RVFVSSIMFYGLATLMGMLVLESACVRPVRQVEAEILRRARQAQAHSPSPAPSDLRAEERVAGSWDAVRYASGDSAIDHFVDRHEIELRWIEGRILGTWDWERDYVASPGRVFRANGSSQCRSRQTFLLDGERMDGEIRLRPLRRLGPPPRRCKHALRPRRDCAFLRRGAKLDLHCGGARWTLSRRRGNPSPLLWALARQDRLTGVWTWHHRSIDSEGDLKIEHETWHLFRRGRRVEGFYDRFVRIRSRDGRPFSCNEALGYENSARFRVQGVLVGEEVYLEEISYAAAPSTCETGRRRLDHYIGKIRLGGAQLELRWPKGAQLLHRRR